MLDDFLVRATLAGVALALAAGPLGCFIVWRRMAYFGDATAHASVLGVALALAFDASIILGTLTVSLAMASLVARLSTRHTMDATLGVLSHSALAFGLVAISFVPSVRVDLSSFLFGDILSVGRTDLAFLWSGSVVVVGLIMWRWSALLTATLNEDLAYSSGIKPKVETTILTVTLAIVVALALKIVGALLIAAMLVIPAATARNLTRTPEAMAVVAIAIGVLATGAGLGLSLALDTPTGPSIVAAAAVAYAISFGFRRLFSVG